MTVSIKLASFYVHCDSTQKTVGSRLAHVHFRGKEAGCHASQLTPLTVFLTLLPTNIRVHQVWAPCDGLASHSSGVLFAFAQMVWDTWRLASFKRYSSPLSSRN